VEVDVRGSGNDFVCDEIIYSVSQKTSPTFLAVTQESIVGFP